jgi:hypothetical protein
MKHIECMTGDGVVTANSGETQAVRYEFGVYQEGVRGWRIASLCGPSPSRAAEVSQAQTAGQPPTKQATATPPPVQAPPEALAGATPKEEPLGDAARRLRAEKAAKKQQEPPNDKP